jgi:NTE family protein
VRIGLVLGAGGSGGLAYHGAVLAALADLTTWDPRSAAVMVGTSAGSISAAMLRGGLPAADLMRITEGLPLSAEGARVAAVGRPHRPRAHPADVLRMRPVADLLGAVHGLAHVRSHSLGTWMAALLPSGGVQTDAISTGIDSLHCEGWPTDPLWLCAVRLRDGKRVVFGQPDAANVPVGQAVAASCAVPGYFRPVTIEGRRYIDGGVRSFTNADLGREAGLDLVLVSSPMTQASGRPIPAPLSVARQPLRFLLHLEIAALSRAGVPVVAIEPVPAVVRAMGLNPLNARPRAAVSRLTYASVTQWLEEHHEGRWVSALLRAAAAESTAAPPTIQPIRPTASA